MKQSLDWHRLIGRSIGIAGLAMMGTYGLHWLATQNILTPLGGWLFLIWTGIVSGGLWAWRDYRRARREQGDRLAYAALDQTYRQVQRQHQDTQAQYQALSQECDRLQQQLQAQHTQAQDAAEAILEDCLQLEQDNKTLRDELKTLKQENWQLREYPHCPPNVSPVVTNGLTAATKAPEPHLAEHPAKAIPVSRLTSISGKQAVRALEQLGFHVEHQNGSHIKLQRSWTQTCIVPNHTEVNPVTLKQVLLQAQVSLEEFLGAL
ncbi:MAG: type II toxin-antitoxin system HicA family toxin [Cyanobacteria bacterium P01_G01_bin.54]